MSSYLSLESVPSVGGPTDDDLVSSTVGGDAAAFGELYERYLERVYRYIFYRVGDSRLAEDLSEAVFLKVLEALPNFQIGAAPFRAWLYRVTHNLLVDYYRTRKEELPLSTQRALVDPAPSPEETLIAREQWDRLIASIGELKSDYQEVISLRFIMGLSHAEAAEVLGRSEGAVRVLQYRALQALLAEMIASEGEHGG